MWKQMMLYREALIVGFITWLACVSGQTLDIQPHDRLTAFIGETLNVTCSVDRSSSGVFNLSRIIFRVYKNAIPAFEHNVTREHVRELNSTTVALAYPNVTAILEQAFVQCCIDSCGEQLVTASSVMIRINKLPPIPEITQYEVDNWDSFWFKWRVDTDTNYSTAVFRSWFKNSNQTEFILCNSSKADIHTCSVDKPFNVALSDGFLDIKVNVSNNYKNVSGREVRVQLHDIVRPRPPKLSRPVPVPSEPDEFFVKFFPPKKGKSTTYTIHVTCRNETFNESWESTPTDGVMMDSEISEQISGLPCYANCTVWVRAAASQMVNQANYLSNWTTGRNFSTAQRVPVGVPEVCTSCFQLVRGTGSEITGVVVYIKPLPDDIACGIVTRYQASMLNANRGWKLDIAVPSRASLLNVTAPYLTEGNEFLKVSVVACTSVGCYHGQQHLNVVHIPGQKYALAAPHLLAVADGDRRVVCRWKPEPTAEHYVIFSCSQYLSAAGLCTSRVNWTAIAGNETDATIVLPPGEDAKKYVFGIAVETAAEHGSSGVTWSNCTHDVDSLALGKPRLKATAVDCCELSVIIQRPECLDGKLPGYVVKYRVSYCPVNNSDPSLDKDKENCLDDLIALEILADIDETILSLGDLQSNQRYLLIAEGLSEKGYVLETGRILAVTGPGRLGGGILAAIIVGSALLLIIMSIGIYTLCRSYQKLIAKIRSWCSVEIEPPSKDNQLYTNGEDSWTGDRLLNYSQPRDLPPLTSMPQPEPVEPPVVGFVDSDSETIEPDQSSWVDFEPENEQTEDSKCDSRSPIRVLPAAHDLDFTFPDDINACPLRRILPAMSDSNVELPQNLSDIVHSADSSNIDSGNSGKLDGSGYTHGEAKICSIFNKVPENNPCPIRVDFDPGCDKKPSLLPSFDSSGDMVDDFFDSGQIRKNSESDLVNDYFNSGQTQKTGERLLPPTSSGMLAVDDVRGFSDESFLDTDDVRTSGCSNNSSDVDPYSKTRCDS